MRTRMLWLVAGVLAATLGAIPRAGQAGTIVLADGRSIQGSVLLVAGGEGKINVQAPGKVALNVTLSDVRMAIFDSRTGADAGSRECDGVRWVRTEVGETKKMGSVEFGAGRITVRDNSEGFRIGKQKKDISAMAPDSCFFVFQKLEGDGEIIGRVLPSEQAKSTRAGLMICEGLDGTGPMALVSRTPDLVGASLLTRERAGEAITSVGDSRNVANPPTWLKLSRTGTMIKAFESINGVQWTPLPMGERKMGMDDKKGVYIGLATTGNLREGVATFENLKLSGKRSEPTLAGVQDTRLPEVAVTLRDGTVLAAQLREITPAGDAKFKKPDLLGGEEVKLPLAQLDRVQFGPLTRSQVEKFTSGASGALTRDGDFLEGEIKEFKGGNLTVSSVTFGLITLDHWRVCGMVFPAAAPFKEIPGLIEVRLQDGSLIVAKRLAAEKDQLIMDEPLLGAQIKVPFKDVVSIDRRGT